MRLASFGYMWYLLRGDILSLDVVAIQQSWCVRSVRGRHIQSMSFGHSWFIETANALGTSGSGRVLAPLFSRRPPSSYGQPVRPIVLGPERVTCNACPRRRPA
jgi:hypothetical protein